MITQNKEIFGRTNRLKILVGLINKSVLVKRYDVAYEISKRFMSDFLKAGHVPIFENLLTHF